MNYIGADVHTATLDFAVVDERGRIRMEKTVATGERNLIEVIRSVPKPRTLYIEEGSLAAWIVEIGKKHRESVVVTDPKKNRWIASSEYKGDKLDARKLGQLARGGYVKEIHHPTGNRRRFRELVDSYHSTVESQTRLKNKIKSKFRQNGIPCTGETVYLEKHREKWRSKLKEEKVSLQIVEELWKQLETTAFSVKDFLAMIRKESKHYWEVKAFQKLPGIGLISAATVSAILETPHRFASNKKVWTYGGYGIAKRESGGKVYSNKLNRNYNRRLKYTIKQSVESAIQSKKNPFRGRYLELTLMKGVLPHRGKLTVGRMMLSTMYGMWKNRSEYDSEKVGGKVKETQTDNSKY